jgi:hypothetical protein
VSTKRAPAPVNATAGAARAKAGERTTRTVRSCALAGQRSVTRRSPTAILRRSSAGGVVSYLRLNARVATLPARSRQVAPIHAGTASGPAYVTAGQSASPEVASAACTAKRTGRLNQLPDLAARSEVTACTTGGVASYLRWKTNASLTFPAASTQ